MLDAPEGLIIVDTTESPEAGQDVLKAFRNITNKPIKAIIFTHNHADHTIGAEVSHHSQSHDPIILQSYMIKVIIEHMVTLNANVSTLSRKGILLNPTQNQNLQTTELAKSLIS